jgi:hypothetical protein
MLSTPRRKPEISHVAIYFVRFGVLATMSVLNTVSSDLRMGTTRLQRWYPPMTCRRAVALLYSQIVEK